MLAHLDYSTSEGVQDQIFRGELVQFLLAEAIESLESLNAQPSSEKSSQNFYTDDQSFYSWWQTHGQNWSEQLDALEQEYYDLNVNWNLDERQQQMLKRYYDSNKMLIECMNRASFPEPELKETIQSSLFLVCC